jgi:23S rRNA pseudouridine2605 synthase
MGCSTWAPDCNIVFKAMRPPHSALKKGQVPLERALSKLGLASRTVAREWIRAGRVSVNGQVRRQALYPVSPERARIEIDGAPVAGAGPRSFLLHKPRGVVTTRADEKGRATVFSLLPPAAGLILHAVGRLDWATSGLLILTNDTKLSAWLTDPLNRVPRVYLVSVRGELGEADLERMEKGIVVEGEKLRADRAVLRKASGKESHLTLELAQGKNREIRRMLAALGHEVTRLKRVSFGGLELGELGPGEFRELSEQELDQAFPGVQRRLRGEKNDG